MKPTQYGRTSGFGAVSLKKYLAILEQTGMVRLLLPAETNLKKRLIKSSKIKSQLNSHRECCAHYLVCVQR